jgi:hypothetical protein
VLTIAAIVGSYFVASSFASESLFSEPDQVVVELSDTHDHVSPPDRLVSELPIKFRLHGDGLALCIDGEGPSEGRVRSTRMTREAMGSFVDSLKATGFSDLAETYQISELPPAQLRESIKIQHGDALKEVAFYNDGAEKPAAYAATETAILDFCRSVTTLYRPDHVVVRTLRVKDTRGEPVKPKRSARIESPVTESEEAQELTGTAAAEALAEFDGTKVHGLAADNSGVFDLAIDQTLPRLRGDSVYVDEGEVKGVNEEEQAPGTAEADGSRPVRYLMLYAADSGSGDLRALRAGAYDARAWYTARMSGKVYSEIAATTVRSVKTAAQLKTCPAGYACNGDELLAVYYNAYKEFYQSDKATIIAVAFPMPLAKACGYGAQAAGFSVMPMPGRFIAGCGYNDQAAFSSTLAHEFGHNLTFQHTTDYTLMDYRRSCRTSGGVWKCTLNSTQRNYAYTNSPYFHAISGSSGLCLEAHPALNYGAAGTCVSHLRTELNYVRNNANTDPAGTYGTSTKAAVTSLQTAYGLPATGNTDAATWAKLHALKNALKR